MKMFNEPYSPMILAVIRKRPFCHLDFEKIVKVLPFKKQPGSSTFQSVTDYYAAKVVLMF